MTAITEAPQFTSLTGDSAYEPSRVFAPLRDQILTKPIIIGQLGQSLDGRIATVSGESRGIGGMAGIDHLHLLRAHVDAVVVGAGTIAIDDPQLNVRRYKGKNPARVVIDPHGRIGGNGRWLADDGARRIVVTTLSRMPPNCDEFIQIDAKDGKLAPQSIADALFARGYKRILVEGGAKTLAVFMAANMLDRLHVVVSPLIIGSGKAGFELEEIPALSQALRPKTQAYLLGGGEVLFDCDLRSPS